MADPLGILNIPPPPLKKATDETDPLGILKKKDTNGLGIVGAEFGGLSPTTKSPSEELATIPIKKVPFTFQEVAEKIGDETKSKTVVDASGNEIVITDETIPTNIIDKSGYRKAIQERLDSKTFTVEDIDLLSQATGKPFRAVEAYAKGQTGKGVKFEIDGFKNDQLANLEDAVLAANNDLGLNDNVATITASPDAATEYLKKIQTLYDTKGKGGLFDSIDKSIENFVEKGTAQISLGKVKSAVNSKILEMVSNDDSLTYDQKVDKIARLTNETDYKNIKQAVDKRNFISKFFSPNAPLPGLTKDEATILNVDKAYVELGLNRDLSQQIVYAKADRQDILNEALEKQTAGTITENEKTVFQARIDALNDFIKSAEAEYKTPTQLEEKYPILFKQNLINKVNEFNALKSGNTTEAGGEGYADKSILEFLQNSGYDLKDQKVQDIVFKGGLIFGNGLKDYSFFGSPIGSAINTFTSTGKSVGDILGIRDDVDILVDKKQEELFPQQVSPTDKYQLTGGAKTGQTVGNLTGQVIAQGLMQSLTGGLGRLAGLSKVAAANTAFWSSGALTSYDQAYKDSFDFIDSGVGRTAYAGLIALANAASEKIFPEVKLFQIPGVKDAISELTSKIGKEGFTDALATQLLTKAKNAFIDYGKKYAKNVGQEVVEEVATDLFESSTRFVFGDPNIDLDKAMASAKNTAIQTATGMAAVAGFGAHKDVQAERNIAPKSVLYNSAIYNDDALDAINKGFDEGLYNERERNSKISILNTAQQGLGELKKAEAIVGRELTRPQREVFVANHTAQALLKEQKKDITDPELIGKVDEKLNNLQNQQKQVLDNEVQFDEFGNVISSQSNNKNESENKNVSQDGGKEVSNNGSTQSGDLQGQNASQRQPGQKEVTGNAAPTNTGAADTTTPDTGVIDVTGKGEKIESIADKVVGKEKLTDEEKRFVEDNKAEVTKVIGKKVMAKGKEAVKPTTETNVEDNSVQGLLKKYNEDTKYNIYDLVNDVEVLAKESGNTKLSEAVSKYREEQAYDNETKGRNDMTAAEDNFVKSIEGVEGNDVVVEGITFKGKRGQADSVNINGHQIEQGKEIDVKGINISQDDSQPNLRSGKYTVKMISVNADGKSGILTLSDGNEIITPTFKDYINSKSENKPLNDVVGGEGEADTKITGKEPTLEGLNRADAKKVYNEVRQLDEPTDAKGLALSYLAHGGKVGEDAINEVVGTVKRASLNTGAKEKKSSEVKARDYTAKNGKSLDDIAHEIWDNLPEELQSKITDQDIKNELMAAIADNNTRLSAAKEYIKQYGIEEPQFEEQANEELTEEENRLNDWLNSDADNNYENEILFNNEALNIINYDTENQESNQQPSTGTTPTGSERNISNDTTQTEEKGTGESVKDKNIGQKARDLAKKVREKGILPSWLKADLPEGTQVQGIDINEAFAKALETFADVYDKVQDFAKAIEEGFKHIRDWYNDNGVAFDEDALKASFAADLQPEVELSVKDTADAIRKDEISYNDATEGKSQTFIDELNTELFGSKKVNFDTDAFKAQVQKQKSFGLTEAEVIEGFEAAKKLTKVQKGIIAEIYASTAETDKIAEELKEAFKALAKGEKPKSVLKRLGVSNVTELVNALKDALTYNAVSNDQLDKMADFIVESIDLNKADQYINAMVNNSVADVRQLLRAKLIVALQKEGNTEMATKLVREMADEATLSGRQTQSLKRAYEILGAQGNPATRTEFARRYAEAVQEKARQMTQRMGDVISEQEAEIGKLNEKLHQKTQRSPLLNKIKDIIHTLCGLRSKK